MRRALLGLLILFLCCGRLVWAEPVGTFGPIDTLTDKTKEEVPAKEVEHAAKDSVRYQVGGLRVAVFEQGRPDKEAEVFFGGRRLGHAPYLVEGLQPGEYPVKVTAQNRIWAGTVKIEPGKLTAVDVTFQTASVSADIYEALLWEDFVDNRNNWSLKAGSLIHDGWFLAKTPKFLDYYIERNHTFQDFALEAAIRVEGERRLFRKNANMTENTFGLVFRVKGSATVLLLQMKGKRIQNYYLLNFDDIEYYSNPIVLSGKLNVPVEEWFRFKVTLRQDELQVFIDSKLVAITQVKHVNEGNFGLVAGPGLTLEVEHLTVGKI